MAAKPWFVIKYKYPNEPWIEWARTQVEKMVSHYEEGARQEYKGALIDTFKESK